MQEVIGWLWLISWITLFCVATVFLFLNDTALACIWIIGFPILSAFILQKNYSLPWEDLGEIEGYALEERYHEICGNRLHIGRIKEDGQIRILKFCPKCEVEQKEAGK